MSKHKDDQPGPPLDSEDAPDDSSEPEQNRPDNDDQESLTEIQQVIESLPEETQQKLGRFFSIAVRSRHVGPLPRPSDFHQYEQIRPGSADDIMQMAKKEQNIQERSVKGRLRNEFFRISVAMVGVVGLCAIAVTAVVLNHPVVASISGVSGALLLVVRSILNRKD